MKGYRIEDRGEYVGALTADGELIEGVPVIRELLKNAVADEGFATPGNGPWKESKGDKIVDDFTFTPLSVPGIIGELTRLGFTVLEDAQLLAEEE